jgi:hypothetical protein
MTPRITCRPDARSKAVALAQKRAISMSIGAPRKRRNSASSVTW